MIKKHLLAAFLLVSTGLFGQLNPDDFQDMEAYAEAKEALSNNTLINTPLSNVGKNKETSNTAVQKSGACWYPLDASFTALTSADLDGGSMDDGYWGPIALGFDYVLYGVTYTEIYINTNGNITFGGGYTSYTPAGFPDAAGPAMIAPFWGDVDLRGTGIDNTVYYKIDGNKIIIIWNEVGYWNSQIAPTNTFQIALSDGSDPYIGVGSNSMFAYDAMDWAVGDFGSSSGGFGTGVFGTAGAQNAGGANYYQIGLFEYDDASYDGPAGANDGIHYLDNGCFITDLSGLNTPPISSNFPATTIDLCVGETYNLSTSYSAPELTQTTTTTVANTSLDAASWSTTIVDGVLSTQELILTPSINDVGTHSLTYISTDNGAPSESTINTVTFNVLAPPTPIITGLTEYCSGSSTTLDAGSGYVSYDWLPNGETNQTVLANTNETYSVSVFDGTCSAVASVVISESALSTGTDTRTECNSYTWIDGVNYTSSNNTATFNIVGGAASGCDSLVTLDLTIINSATGTDTRTECNSYTWIDGINYTSSNNTATFNIIGGSANGCDSLVTLDLTIINSVTGTDTRTECDSYTWIDGINYTSSNITATFNIIGGAANGCDSLVNLDLTINSSSSSTQTETALDSYTWPVNNQTYIQSGTYTAVITNAAGCDSTVTLDLTMQFTGIEENQSSVYLVYPNPAHNEITISVESVLVGTLFSITDNAGRVVLKEIFRETEYKVNLSPFENGVYFIRTVEGGRPVKIIKH
jgi:hypothetical protein